MISLLAPLHARATPPATPPVTPEVQMRFALAEATLDTESRWAKKSRLLVSSLGVGLGSATVGVGSVLLARGATGGGIVTLGQGGLALLGGIYGLLWRRDPFEELMRDVDRTRRLGGPSAQSMFRLELRWYELAVKQRRWRKIEGVASATIGAMLLTAATVIAVAPNDMDPTLRGLYTRSLLGGGIGALGVGIASLVVPSAIERSYLSFERAGHAPVFRLGPIAGGGAFSFGASF